MRRLPRRWRSERLLLSRSASRLAVCTWFDPGVVAGSRRCAGPGESFRDVICEYEGEFGKVVVANE